jgi:hypothetical protein
MLPAPFDPETLVQAPQGIAENHSCSKWVFFDSVHPLPQMPRRATAL